MARPAGGHGFVAVFRLVCLPGPAYARPGAGAFAPVCRQLHHDLVSRHVVPGDDPRPFRGLHCLAKLRRLLLELLVQRVLVLQAAHQPPARPGDPQRVDGQVLVLGHPDRHRLEVLEEGGAAQVTAARPDPALQPGLVPRADLPQLDPPAEAAGQVADEGAEVDPARRAEVHGENRRLVDVVHADHLHRQPVVADQPPGGDPRLGAFRAVVLVPAQVLVGGEARADRQPAHVLVDPLRRPHAYGHFRPAVRGHQHLGAHGGHVGPGVEIVQAPVPLETDSHHHAHRPRVRSRGARVRRRRGRSSSPPPPAAARR